MNAKSFMAIALFSLLLWAGLIGLVKVACGADIYLNAVTGDDWAAGTISAPLKTCSAVNRATPAGGDFINFQGGQAFGAIQNDTTLTIPTSGTAGHPVTYRSTPGTGMATQTGAAPPSVWGTGTGWQDGTTGYGAKKWWHLIAKDDSVYACWKSDSLMTRVMTLATLDAHKEWLVRTAAGATLDTLVAYFNTASDTASVWRSKAYPFFSANAYTALSNLHVTHGTGSGVGSTASNICFAAASTSPVVTACISDSSASTISCGLRLGAVGTITNNIFRMVSLGVYDVSNSSGSIIHNNTFINCQACVYSTKNANVKNNIMCSPSSYFIICFAGTNVFSNNQYYATSYTNKWTIDWSAKSDLATWAAASGDVNSQTGDPLFTSETDYRLQSGSPCINAGTDVGLTTDFFGDTVPYGSAPEMGAIEYYIPKYARQTAAGDSTGRSYNNAMSRAQLNAKTDFAAGDTVLVCDTWTADSATPMLTPASAGTAVAPIIYSGSMPGHPGVLNGNNLATTGIRWTAVGCKDIHIEDLTIQDVKSLGVYMNNGNVYKGHAGYVFKRLNINRVGIDSVLAGLGSMAIFTAGTNIRITECTIDSCKQDGVYATGDSVEIDNNTITNVSLQGEEPDGDGDCIQEGSSYTSLYYHVHHNTLDHGPNYAKSATMITGARDAVFEYNTVTAPKIGLDFTYTGSPDSAFNCTVRNNYFLDCGKNAIEIAGFNGDMYNNIISGGGTVTLAADTASVAAIYVTSSQEGRTLNVYHNTVYNWGRCGFRINETDASTVTNHHNNIYHTIGRHFLYVASTTPTFNSENNIYYTCAITPQFYYAAAYTSLNAYRAARSKESGSVYANPMFTSAAGGNFIPLRGSLAIHKGKYVGVLTDYVGNVRGKYPTVGAYEVRGMRRAMGEIGGGLLNELNNGIGF